MNSALGNSMQHQDFRCRILLRSPWRHPCNRPLALAEIRCASNAARRLQLVEARARKRFGRQGWRLEQRTGPQPEDELTLSEETEAEPVLTGDYMPGDKLGGRYTVVGVLGRGSSGVTYRAEGPDGTVVAVKALSLRRMTDWKQLELFEREAKTLKSLDHPGIPKYIDYLSEDTEMDRGFFLVQELAEGQALAQMVREGWRANEKEVSRIAQEVLRILGYLGRCRPAVTHRDVKAENIVLEGGQAGGRVYLVDFGGVQAAAVGDADALQTGSTIIGTYGYMAPEQFRGQATPASDLYGLGGTLLFILSGRLPSSFPQNGLKIEFRDALDVSQELGNVIEGLLEPMGKDRLSADDALGILEGRISYPAAARLARTPSGGFARVTIDSGSLEVFIPRRSMFSAERVGIALAAVVWNVLATVCTLWALTDRFSNLGLVMSSLCFLLLGFQLARNALAGALSSEHLTIGGRTWLFKRGEKLVKSGMTADLMEANAIGTGSVFGEHHTRMQLLEGFKKLQFGGGLCWEEQVWLAKRINEHIKNC